MTEEPRRSIPPVVRADINDPEQMRRELERTRTELSERVNALGDKFNPGRQVGRVHRPATSVKDTVLGSASDAVGTAQLEHGPDGSELKESRRDVPSASEARQASTRPSIVQVEAAKLRLVTDRRLGKVSPEWLKRVAKGLPPQVARTTG